MEGQAHGIYGSSSGGPVTVTSTGNITTGGNSAYGILAQSNDAVMGDVGFDVINAERAQSVSDYVGGAFFAIGKLRVHVEVPAPINEFLLH